MNDRERDVVVSKVIAAASAACSGDRFETLKVILLAVVSMAGQSVDPFEVMTGAIGALTAARAVPFTPEQQDVTDGH